MELNFVIDYDKNKNKNYNIFLIDGLIWATLKVLLTASSP